jgi:hypothetical protein
MRSPATGSGVKRYVRRAGKASGTSTDSGAHGAVGEHQRGIAARYGKPALLGEQINATGKTPAARLGRHRIGRRMRWVRLLARVTSIGIEAAQPEYRVREMLWRRLRDRSAVARCAGLTGSPDESALNDERRSWPGPAMRGYDAG